VLQYKKKFLSIKEFLMNQIVILAAGRGTRMNSELPKALVPLKGKPMINHLLDSVVKADIDKNPIIIVSPDNREIISEALKDYKVQYAIQSEQLGSGHAVACAKDLIKPETDNIIVLYCDHPFLSAESLKKCATTKIEAVMVMTTKLPDFDDWRHNFYHWGRFVRNAENEIERIVEFKDATPEEQTITEVNPGFMAFNSSWLWPNLKLLSNDNAQHEFYLTSLPGMAFAEGYKIPSISIEAREAMGINSLEELKVSESLF